VYQGIVTWFDSLASTQTPTVAVADVPLLYETGGERVFDRVVVAACRPDQQIARLRARDGLSEEDARLRLAAQWPIDRKRALADIVIDTSGTMKDTDTSVDEAYARLKREALGA
jgi:dephospho-CoA kinase